MLLMIKRILSSIDLFFGYLMSVFMRFFLYVFSFALCTLGVLDILITPFSDESSDDIFSFSLNELDNLEALVILVFIFVTVRFFKRSKAEGVTLWLRSKSYVFVSAVSVMFSFAIYVFVIMLVMIDRGVINPSVFYENSDLEYFSTVIFSILALLGWLQKIRDKKESIVTEPDQPSDFTHAENDSVDSDETDSSHSSSLNSDQPDNK